MNIRTLHCFIRTMLMIALLFSQLSLPALAQTQTSAISVKIDGQLQQYEQPPVNANGSVLVPMRAIFEALGAKVTWVASTKDALAAKGNTTVGIRIGETMAHINSDYLKLQQPAQMVNGYTMVPVRFVSEALGARVDWDVETQTVVINTRLDRKAVKDAASPMGIPLEAEWKSFNTDYFEIHYYKAEEQVFQDSYEFDDIYKKAVEKFGHKPSLLSAEQTRVPILILAQDDFKRVLQLSSDAAWSTKRKAVFINLRESEKVKGVNDLYVLIRHELTHAITLNSADSKARNIPFWIMEGVTTVYEVEPPYLQSSREPTLKKAFLAGSLLTWNEMSTPGGNWDRDKFILAYAEAQSIYSYLSTTYGEKKITDLFFTDGDYKSLLEQATGKSISDLEKEWLDFVKKNYSARNGYFIGKGLAGTIMGYQ